MDQNSKEAKQILETAKADLQKTVQATADNMKKEIQGIKLGK